MKVVKLTKKLLKLYPSRLLIKLGAVDKEHRRGFPEHVYFSRADYKALRKNMLEGERKAWRKAWGYNRAQKRILLDVEMGLLNLGPNCSISEAIKPGYALVDYDAIEAELEK